MTLTSNEASREKEERPGDAYAAAAARRDADAPRIFGRPSLRRGAASGYLAGPRLPPPPPLPSIGRETLRAGVLLRPAEIVVARLRRNYPPTRRGPARAEDVYRGAEFNGGRSLALLPLGRVAPADRSCVV